jgi:hypothetical protein
MNRCRLLLKIFAAAGLFATGCTPRDADTDPEGTVDHAGDPECASDDDCGSGAICSADACVDGDRNDEVTDADVLDWDDPVDGEINPAGEVDWYAVDADGGQFVRISVVTEDGGDLDSVVSVYDAAGDRVAWEDEHPAGDVSSADSMCFAYFAEPGTYAIKVEDTTTFNGEAPVGGPDSTYTLEITEWNSVGVEPDSAHEAGLDFGALSANVLYSFPVLLTEAGESDWAAIDLPAAGAPVYLVALQHGDQSELTPVVSMRNQAGDEVLSLENPTPDDPALLPNPSGTSYVIGVTDAAGGYGSRYWTWLFFLLRDPGTGNPAEVEPDDDPGTATVVELEDQGADSGTWFAAYGQGAVASEADADVYAFDIPFDGAYVNANLGAQKYGSLLITRLELLDSAGAVLDTVDSLAGTDTNGADLGPYDAGAYFLRVSAATGGTGGEGWYYLFKLNASSYTFAD